MNLDIFDIAEENLITEMNLFLKNEVNINEVNDLGLSALHLSISKGHEEMALLLIENGTNLYLKDNHGLSPLHFAAQKQMINVAKVILQKEPESIRLECNYGAQPLWYAVHNLKKPFDIITLFLEKGADKDHGDATAFDRAKSYDIEEVVALFDGY